MASRKHSGSKGDASTVEIGTAEEGRSAAMSSECTVTESASTVQCGLRGCDSAAARERSATEVVLVERTGAAAAAAAAAAFEKCSLCASDSVGARDKGVEELLPGGVVTTGRASSLPLNERVAGTAAGSAT